MSRNLLNCGGLKEQCPQRYLRGKAYKGLHTGQGEVLSNVEKVEITKGGGEWGRACVGKDGKGNEE